MKALVKLDRIDLKILHELQVNARITNQDLAEKICLSPSSCLQRVRRLESEEVLMSYHAKINLPIVCRHLVCLATVSLSNHSHSDFKSFEKLINSIPEVVECYTVSGEFDFFLKVICPDMSNYLEINDRLVSSVDYAVNVSTHVVMSHTKTSKSINIQQLRESG